MEGEAEVFAFDIAAVDWRHYWMEVEVPGLETWSIPILRGEKVPDDEPMPNERSERASGVSYGRASDAAE